MISVTELPKIDIKNLQNIQFDQYKVKIEDKETDKEFRNSKISKKFCWVDDAKVANEGDLVIFDYKATVDGKDFKGNEEKYSIGNWKRFIYKRFW